MSRESIVCCVTGGRRKGSRGGRLGTGVVASEPVGVDRLDVTEFSELSRLGGSTGFDDVEYAVVGAVERVIIDSEYEGLGEPGGEVVSSSDIESLESREAFVASMAAGGTSGVSCTTDDGS